jgi:capsular exopolysaccharide synthesis family protein
MADMDSRARGSSYTFLPGGIPAVELPAEQLKDQLIVGFDSSDGRSRSFNLLRTQVTKLMEANGWKMLGVTSATPGAGKSFTSTNLAAALSRAGSRTVILCDLDMRQGSILKQLGVEVEATLDDYLRGERDDWRVALFRVNSDRLIVLPTGSGMRDSSEMLTSGRFATLMAELRALSRDYIVLCDLPPVFANDDAMLSMRYLDAYLLVVDHGRTTARQIDETLALMAPAQCIGTVLNRYQGGIADAYGYGYGDTYGLRDYGAET